MPTKYEYLLTVDATKVLRETWKVTAVDEDDARDQFQRGLADYVGCYDTDPDPTKEEIIQVSQSRRIE